MKICDLPTELLLLIISYLPTECLRILCLTQSTFNRILSNDNIWRERILQDSCQRSAFRGSLNLRLGNTVVDATTDSLTRSPQPYDSYHQLYIKIFRRYSWMLGTFVGNAPWTGSLIEVFYNHFSGLVECRRLQTQALFGDPRLYTRDRQVVWRDFDPVMQTWHEPLFMLGEGAPDDQFSAQVSRTIGITDKATIRALDSNQLWPTKNVPVKERIIVDQVHPLSRLGNGFDSFSDNLLCLTRPVLSRTMPGHGADDETSPRHTELFCRIPGPNTAPSGFEDFVGLFMGDYSAHGPELVYLHYPTPTSLCAVKITGDPNVPRGEYTWMIENLEEEVRICNEREWRGGRAYEGKGQISVHGFTDPTWIEAEVILYQAPTGDIPHTVQSAFAEAGEDVSPSVLSRARSIFAVEPPGRSSIVSQVREDFANGRKLRVDKPCVALWWKGMGHLSIFHKVTSVDDNGRDLIQLEVALYHGYMRSLRTGLPGYY